jgi:hypothetical protein
MVALPEWVMWYRLRVAESGPEMTGLDSVWGEAMKSDSEIRDDVMEELRWEPRISDPDGLGVAVRDAANWCLPAARSQGVQRLGSSLAD